MPTLKELLNNVERAKYNFLIKKIENAQTRITVKYYEWRALRTLEKAKDRIRLEHREVKKDNALSRG